MADVYDGNDKIGDREIQEFLMIEKQRAQLTAQIHELNKFCWDKCIDRPSNKFDSKTEACVSNCVNRFLDVSLLITNRFANMFMKSTDSLS